MSLATHAARVLELANAALEAIAALEEAEGDAVRDLPVEGATAFEDEEQSLYDASMAVSAMRHAATRALEDAAREDKPEPRVAKRPRRALCE